MYRNQNISEKSSYTVVYERKKERKSDTKDLNPW